MIIGQLRSHPENIRFDDREAIISHRDEENIFVGEDDRTRNKTAVTPADQIRDIANRIDRQALDEGSFGAIAADMTIKDLHSIANSVEALLQKK